MESLSNETLDYLLKRQRKRVLQECRTLAVVGASPDPQSPSAAQIEKLLALGLSIHPILPGCRWYFGLTCYSNLTSIPQRIDIILIFSDHTFDLADLAHQARDKQVGAFWIEEGELSADIKTILARAKIQVIEHESLAADYSRHFPFTGRTPEALPNTRKITVGARMTRHPVTIKRTDDLKEAVGRMHSGHFRHIPVIDDQGCVVGIVSDRDLRLIHPSPPYVPTVDVQREIGPTRVEQAAFFDPVTISADASLEHAAATMLRWDVGALPVVRNGNTLAGIITYTDVLREFVARGRAIVPSGNPGKDNEQR